MSTSLVGRLFNQRYKLVRLVASGGMATVFLATDGMLARDVAVKVLHSHLARDPKTVNRFRQEARTAAIINHINVVRVFDQGVDSETGLPFLVMEYVDGQTLRTVLNHHVRFAPHIAMAYLAAIVNGLAAAHKKDLVHRDMKPENVLVSKDGVVKVADFGLMRPSDQHTATQSILGTVAYVSPELVLGKLADKRTDIYAVGIMFYEMLTGTQPFKGDSSVQVAYKHAHERVPDPGILVPDLPQQLKDLVLLCTEPDPNDRPSDAVVLAEHINQIRASKPEPAQRASEDTEVLEQQRTTVLPPVNTNEAGRATEVLESTVREHIEATAVLDSVVPAVRIDSPQPPPPAKAEAGAVKLTSAQRRVARRAQIQLRRPHPFKATIGWLLFLAGAGVLGYLGFIFILDLLGY